MTTAALPRRTSREGPFFTLWRDPAVLAELVHPDYLTTARYEPILRRGLGAGHVDLLFESGARSCVVAGLRLDPNGLVTRERSPFVWPMAVAAALADEQLQAIEQAVLPWLRATARARCMATEAVRSYVRSERFERARAAGLFGAVALERSLPRMEPFVYARRFARGKRVVLDCSDAPLGQAVLADLAASLAYGPNAGADDFASAWFGVTRPAAAPDSDPDLAVVDRRGRLEAGVIIERAPDTACAPALIEIPSPAPWDLQFAFDSADAPAVAVFGVHAAEAPLREPLPLVPGVAVGGSSGTIVLAVSADALAMRGNDIEEVHILARRLAAEGFDVEVATAPGDSALDGAQLLHIFGAPTDQHTIAFAEHARTSGIAFVLDVTPLAADPSMFTEHALSLLHRSALDEAERNRYVAAYESDRVERGDFFTEPSAEEFSRTATRFGIFALHAAALLAAQEDRAALLAQCPQLPADRIIARGVFAEPEPAAAAIGHLVPDTPFAFVHGTIGAHSHALHAALAAELQQIPLVVAGPVYDVDYLQTLRSSAPSAIVLGDAPAGVICALYRRAAVYVDPAARPRSAAGLLRALACGALPVLAAESPLVRIAGAAVQTFHYRSIGDCAAAIVQGLGASDREARLTQLRTRLLARRDPDFAFRTVMAAYARAAAAV